MDEKWNKCGRKVECFCPDLYKANPFRNVSRLLSEIVFPANVDKKWTKCGRNVERMWTECGQNVETMWTECGNKVGRMLMSSLQANHGHTQVQTVPFSKPPCSKIPIWAFLSASTDNP